MAKPYGIWSVKQVERLLSSSSTSPTEDPRCVTVSRLQQLSDAKATGDTIDVGVARHSWVLVNRHQFQMLREADELLGDLENCLTDIRDNDDDASACALVGELDSLMVRLLDLDPLYDPEGISLFSAALDVIHSARASDDGVDRAALRQLVGKALRETWSARSRPVEVCFSTAGGNPIQIDGKRELLEFFGSVPVRPHQAWEVRVHLEIRRLTLKDSHDVLSILYEGIEKYGWKVSNIAMVVKTLALDSLFEEFERRLTKLLHSFGQPLSVRDQAIRDVEEHHTEMLRLVSEGSNTLVSAERPLNQVSQEIYSLIDIVSQVMSESKAASVEDYQNASKLTGWVLTVAKAVRGDIVRLT